MTKTYHRTGTRIASWQYIMPRPKVIALPHWFLFSARDFTCELCSTRKPRHNVITSSRQINLSISHTQEQAPLRDSKGSSGNSSGCPCYSLFTGQCRAKKGEAARCARRPLGRADPRAPWKGTEFERRCSGTGEERDQASVRFSWGEVTELCTAQGRLHFEIRGLP